jgi:hypothetical protein
VEKVWKALWKTCEQTQSNFFLRAEIDVHRASGPQMYLWKTVGKMWKSDALPFSKSNFGKFFYGKIPAPFHKRRLTAYALTAYHPIVLAHAYH